MLKIKFWRIENVILMKVLEQGDGIEKNCGIVFEDKDTEICISSLGYPDCDKSRIFIRGYVDKDNDFIATHRCKDIEEAKELLNRYVLTVKHYNESLIENNIDNLNNNEFECIVAE